jgi:high-affinity iron transporter
MKRATIHTLVFAALISTTFVAPLRAGEVSGRVEMPSTCSPTVSPAVVSLERLDKRYELVEGRGAKVALINQRGLQFEPRVQAVQVGQTIQFTNDDNENHNVHILTPGSSFNQVTGRGRAVDFVTNQPGLLRIVCDIHSHMRGYVLVSPTPYFAVCRPDGRFRLDDVADGKYRLQVWHEMGQGTSREIEVKGNETVTLSDLSVEAAPLPAPGSTGPVRAWPEVTDRIGVLLGEARAVVNRKDGVKKARKLIEDAYLEEFEGSEMETAVRRHLGFQRAGEIEGQFKSLRTLAREVGEGKAPLATMADKSRELLLTLVALTQELNLQRVTDGSKVSSVVSQAETVEEGSGNLEAQQRALAAAFESVSALADAGQADESASAMTSAYFDAFDPLERRLLARRPQAIRPLEARFNATRGRIGQGLKGTELKTELARLQQDVVSAIDQSQAGGTFGTAFFASLITILREGVEVILLLTMLISLVAKTGQPKALSAIRWGVALAALASVLTAVGLNLLVVTSQGRAREQIEGWVLMLASGVLFYVSYWLISQTESKRWTDFLKDQVKRGVAVGGFGTLGLTAFLAVYREGAETALMYQGLVAGQAGSRLGVMGVVAGLVVGLMALAVIYQVLRTQSMKLPLRSFFKVTGFVLFAMSIVFAGNGVFELQSAGLLKTTPLAWMGAGLPWIGIHPNLQSLMVQGLLLTGAIAAFVILARGGSPKKTAPEATHTAVATVEEPTPASV